VSAIWWLWSFRRLWVAVISRHSERQADLPRRWKRSIRRLNFVWPNTGSTVFGDHDLRGIRNTGCLQLALHRADHRPEVSEVR